MPHAVICRALGPPESLSLETVEPRPLGAGQVRVTIHAAGINFPDVLQIQGLHQHKPSLPFVPGFEAAGVVAEVAAGVDGVVVGDNVMVHGRGTYTDEI